MAQLLTVKCSDEECGYRNEYRNNISDLFAKMFKKNFPCCKNCGRTFKKFKVPYRPEVRLLMNGTYGGDSPEHVTVVTYPEGETPPMCTGYIY